MKLKKFLPLMVLLFSLSLASCGKDENPSLEDRLEGQRILESFEGVIKGVSKNVYQQGTHELETEDGEIVYIQSSTINLNKYIGEAVMVEGEEKEGVGNSKPVLTVTKIDYLKNDESKPELESELKLYKDNSFGIELEHPSTWLINKAGGNLEFKLEGELIAELNVFDVSDLETFAFEEEGRKSGDHVTTAGQPAIRYLSGDEVTFYLSNPSHKKVYQFQFNLSEELVKNEDIDHLKQQFYDMVQSIQFDSSSRAQSQACGGEPAVECPEDYFCELEDDSENAEGVCVEIGSKTDSEELGRGLTSEDISQIQVTREYTNDKLGFSMSYPSEWYYVSFGPVDGSQGKIGFAPGEFEDLGDAVITMTLQSSDGGQASKKMGDLYYVFEGPSEWTKVMEKMAGSLVKAEE